MAMDRHFALRRLEGLEPKAAFALLDTGPDGLSATQAAARLRLLGPNRIQKDKGPSILSRFFANYAHLMAILLWIGGATAFAASMPEMGVAIWMVNIINGLFSFWQEFRVEKAMEALSRLLPTRSTVIRGGVETEIDAEELVPGDVILLEEGIRIPADCLLLASSDLRVDQSTLTGESRPVRKSVGLPPPDDSDRRRNIVLAGCSVSSGDARALVLATGMDTGFGRIARLTRDLGGRDSPLQREIRTVTRVISAVAVGAGAVFFLLAVSLAHMGMAASFIFSLGMIVAFVPEGLLPTVTLSLAMGMRRMARRNALVKRLSCVETLGCATVICTDKTGTITKNEMTVRHVVMAGKSFTVTGSGYATEGAVLRNGVPVTADSDDDLRQFVLTGLLCNNARLVPATPGSASPAHGDPTEVSLLVMAVKAGLNLETERQSARRAFELPFEARRKRMSVVCRERGKLILRHKGAPATVLALCTHILDNGTIRDMTPADAATMGREGDRLARRGFRVLALAMGEARPGEKAEEAERGLTLLGLAGIMDPPRPEAAGAVAACRRAGVRVVMITGDYGLTAESAARETGIIRMSDDGSCGRARIVTGEELDAMDGPALRAVLQEEVIFARAAPEHKLRVVAALQEFGHVAAVTGDGVNDAPALKKADIGVAMGRSGADVAREAADMILLDDNFASIVNAIEEGRAVFANIRKFTSYIFTSNTPEAVPFILHALSGGRIPLALGIMQILAVDLGTDIAPALALGADPPEPGVMDQPPRSKNRHVIDGRLLIRAYLWLGPAQSLAAMAAFFFMYWMNGYAGQWLDLPTDGLLYHQAMAMTLAAIVTTQIGNLFAQRRENAPALRIMTFASRAAWMGVAVELLVVAALIYFPVLARLIDVAPFPTVYWVWLLSLSPMLLLVDEARKAITRRTPHSPRGFLLKKRPTSEEAGRP